MSNGHRVPHGATQQPVNGLPYALAPEVMQGDIDCALRIAVAHNQAIHLLPRGCHRCGIASYQRRCKNLVHHADDGGQCFARSAAKITAPVRQRSGLTVPDEPLVGRDAHEHEATQLHMQASPLETTPMRETEGGRFQGPDFHLDLRVNMAGPMLAAADRVSNNFFLKRKTGPGWSFLGAPDLARRRVHET